ncbi:MAG: GNAT family N-acetyltransferase [Dehalococcoidales bacterium]|nr:MAG: GNAT family N-acetyltransferase [Dehalococcoidales bacterium]
MKIRIRKFDERTDTRIIEYQPDRTIIYTAGGSMSSLFSKSEFLDLFTPDGFWIAFSHDIPIGAVLFGKCDKEKPSCAAIYGIRVDEQYRRRGIGGVLSQKADKYVRSNSIDRIILHTTPDNIAAITLCKKAGFIISENSVDKMKMMKKMRIR